MILFLIQMVIIVQFIIGGKMENYIKNLKDIRDFLKKTHCVKQLSEDIEMLERYYFQDTINHLINGDDVRIDLSNIRAFGKKTKKQNNI